jgi:hypothetical protein
MSFTVCTFEFVHSKKFMSSDHPEPFKSTFSLPLGREAEEWAPIEAFLHVIYRTSNLTLRSLWSVSSPSGSAKFEKRVKDLTAVVPTVIAAQDIGAKLTLSAVCDRGFPDSASGIRIQVGNQSLPSRFLDAGVDGTRKQGRGRRVFECLIAKVGVGKSYVLDPPHSSDDNLIEDLAPEYDSVLIRPSAEDISMHALTVTSSIPGNLVRGFLPPHTFCQTYIVREGAQVLPLFVCRFEVDTDKEEPLSLSPCQNCDVNPATIWCAADSAALCPECDELHHALNALTQRHIRVPVNERPRPAGPCGIRSEKQAELWSEAMAIAVSKETQKEQYPTTKFEDIREAYKTSVRVARRENEDVETMKHSLLGRIKAEDEAISSVERMLDSCEETAYRKIGDALQRALRLTEQRTAGLLEKETKLLEQIQFIQWSETLLTPLAHLLPPTEWMELYLKVYRMVRLQVLSSKTGEPDTDEDSVSKAEIKLDGHILTKDLLKVKNLNKLVL